MKKPERKKAGKDREEAQVTRPLKVLERHRCQGLTKRGNPCRFTPIGGTEFCLWHSPDPAIQERARRAVHKGGLVGAPRHLPADHPAVKIGSVKEALGLIETTVQQVRTGALSPNVANAITYAISTAARLLELDLLSELEALETMIGVKLTRRDHHVGEEANSGTQGTLTGRVTETAGGEGSGLAGGPS